MVQKIYVGNLPFSATEAEVQQLFAEYGSVESVALPSDRETGQMRGFGFVEMDNADATKAIAGHTLAASRAAAALAASAATAVTGRWLVTTAAAATG